MSRETNEPMDQPPDRSDLDPRTAEAIEQAYAERVDLDTAAGHLWVLYRSAGAVETALRGEGREQPADDAPSEGGPGRQVARLRHVALSVLTGATILATSGGAVAASGSALPGDTLYALKRGTEQVRLVIATGSGTEAQMRVELARERWTEAKRLAGDRPEAVPGLVRDAVEALEAAERGEGQAPEEAGSLRRQLVDESPMVAADLDERGRRDVKTSMNRLAGSDTADVAGGDGGHDQDVSTTEVPEPGVEEAGVAPSAPTPSQDGDTAEEDGESGPAGQEPGDDGQVVDDGQVDDHGEGEADGAGDESDEAPEGQSEEAADAPEEDTAADVAEDALETDEVAVDDEDVTPDDEDVPPEAEEENLDLREGAQRGQVQGQPTDRDTSDRRSGTATNRQSGEAAGEGAGPHSSPTLSPDPTQQHVGGSSG